VETDNPSPYPTLGASAIVPLEFHPVLSPPSFTKLGACAGVIGNVTFRRIV